MTLPEPGNIIHPTRRDPPWELGTKLGPHLVSSSLSNDVLPRQRESKGFDHPVPRSIPDLSICREQQ